MAGVGTVGLNVNGNNLRLSYPAGVQLANLSIADGANVDASGLGGGNIQVQGGGVSLTEGANIVADTLGSVDGGSINIQADQLVVQDRAFISASTFGSGAAGNLSVTALKSVELMGNGGFDLLAKLLTGTFNPVSDRANGLFTLSAGAGAAGDLTINTDQLTLRDGAVGLGATFFGGEGRKFFRDCLRVSRTG